MHGSEALTGVALIAVVAALIGLGLVRFKQPAIVGYILTGIVLGPSGFGFVSDREAIALLAELGVILLLFFIGMELSLRSFRLIWKAAILIGIAQILLGLLAIFWPAWVFDWPIAWVVLGGFCLALSSTAVAFNILEDVKATKSRAGRMTVGVLIAQDLAVAPMLLIISGLKNMQESQGDSSSLVDAGSLSFIAFELTLTIGLLAFAIFFLSKRKRFYFSFLSHALHRKDLLPLVALALCFGVASLAGLLGLSPAFGAFMAGLIIGNSRHRDQLRHSAEPVQAVLMMVFFLSVGLLVNLQYVWDNILLIMFCWFLVTIFKTFCNMILARLVGLSWQDALMLALVIAQMGEFSFVLTSSAYAIGVIDDNIQNLIVSLTVLSLISSPLYVQLVRRNRHRALRHIDGLKAMLQLVFYREVKLSRLAYRHLLKKPSANKHDTKSP